jgi:hypothetical protein
MAATMAICIGEDSSRVKQDHRLGSRMATGKAQTWRTFAVCTVMADGSGYVQVSQNGVLLGRITFGPEDQPPAVSITGKPRL